MINAVASSINTTSRVTLTVYNASKSRSASTYTDIVVTGNINPVLRISSPLPSLISVNTAKTFALTGSVQTSVGCVAVWSVDDVSIDLSKSALSPVSALIPATSFAVFTPFNLVLAANVLPTAATLTFALTCDTGQTALPITTNAPPLPGMFTVIPDSGQELLTVFQFNALQWSDTDLPLTYQFGIVPSSTATIQVLMSRSQLTYTSSTLPAGAPVVNCTLQVYDNMAAFTSASALVTVTATSTTEEARWQQVLSLVDAGIARGTTTATISSTVNLIAVASAVMNSINCTLAPDCAGLHRSGCTQIENTCGACLNGYVGDLGYKNTPCVPLDSAVSTNAVCRVDADCNTYQYCDVNTRTCVVSLKGCNSDCSNHGTCLYLSIVTGEEFLSRCGIDNPKCEAVCSCASGYSGLSCEMDIVTLRTRREVRSKLIGALTNLTQLQDVNADALSVWSSSLYALALNPYELSMQDAITAARIANTTMTHARLQNVDVENLVGILQVTDALASLMRYNYNPHDYSQLESTDELFYGPNSAINIVQVTRVFGELVVNNMHLGQERVTYYFTNFRLGIHKSTLPARTVHSANMSVLSPQTALEILVAEPTNIAVITPSLEAAAVVGVQTLSIFPRTYTTNSSRFLSTPMYLQISTDSVTTAPVDYISTLDFTLPFHSVHSRFEEPPVIHNVTSICTAQRGVGRPGPYINVEHTYTCPGSGAVIVHNCTGILGTLTSFCPEVVPNCAHLDVSSVGMSPLRECTLLAYNSTYTTWRCAVSSTSSSPPTTAIAASATTTNTARRRLESSEVITSDGTVNMVATASYVTLVGDVFSPGVFPVVAETSTQSYYVLYTLSALGGACLTILGVFLYQQRTQKTKIVLSKNKVYDDVCIERGVCMDQAQRLITHYLTTVLPAPFRRNISRWSAVVIELSLHHRYFTLFSARYRHASVAARSLVLVKLLTHILVTMGLLALFYHLNSPDDDNLCNSYLSETECVRDTRYFDPTQSVCSWNYHAHLFIHTCDFKEKYTNATGFVNILVLTAVCMAVLSPLLDSVFRVLAAPLLTTRISRSVAVAPAENPSLRSLKQAHSARYVRKTVNGRTIWATKSSQSRVAPAPAPGIVQSSTRADLFAVSAELTTARTATAPFVPAVLRNVMALQVSRKANETIDTDYSVETMRAALVSKTTRARRIGADAALTTLSDALLAHRRLLPPWSEQTRLFDAQWGVQSALGDSAHVFRFGQDVFTLSAPARAALRRRIQSSDRHTAALRTSLICSSPTQAGVLLIQTFLMDVLGAESTIGRIFWHSFQSEYDCLAPVSVEQKLLCGIFVLVLNAVLLYAIFTVSFAKQDKWQVCYVVAAGAQIAFDVLIGNTVECVALYYTIPRLVQAEVGRAVDVMLGLVTQLTVQDTQSGSTDPADRASTFNAMEYLSVSHKLALERPHLLESTLILSYTTPLPGACNSGWLHHAAKQEFSAEQRILTEYQSSCVSAWYAQPHRKCGYVVLWLGVQIVTTLRYIGTCSLLLRQLIVNKICITAVGGLVLCSLAAYKDFTARCVVAAVAGLLLCAIIWRRWYLHTRTNMSLQVKVVPIPIKNSPDPSRINSEQTICANSATSQAPRLLLAPDNSESSVSVEPNHYADTERKYSSIWWKTLFDTSTESDLEFADPPQHSTLSTLYLGHRTELSHDESSVSVKMHLPSEEREVKMACTEYFGLHGNWFGNETDTCATHSSRTSATTPATPAMYHRNVRDLRGKELIDAYEVNSSIFSTGDNTVSSLGGEDVSSSSGSSGGRGRSIRCSTSTSNSSNSSDSRDSSDSSSTASVHKEYKSSLSGNSSAEECRKRKYGHFDAHNVDSYKPTPSIFSSEEDL